MDINSGFIYFNFFYLNKSMYFHNFELWCSQLKEIHSLQIMLKFFLIEMNSKTKLLS